LPEPLGPQKTDLQVDVLQIVLRRAANDDVVLRAVGVGERGGGLPTAGGVSARGLRKPRDCYPWASGRTSALLPQHVPQRLPRVRLLARGDVLRRPFGDDAAAAGTPFRTEVEHPIRGFDDIEIVFDNDDGVPGIDEAVQHAEQVFDVDEMQPGRRFVENVDRLAGGALAKLLGQLHALGFTAGERGGRLTELEVIEADVVQRLQQVIDLLDVLEVLERLLHVHVEHLGDALPLEPDLQRLLAEPPPLADRARHPDVGEEIHLQLGRAVPLARLAAAPLDVEAEPARLEPPAFRVRQLRVQVADQIEQLDVRRRVGPGRAADRRLIDVDRFVDVLQPLDAVVRARLAQPFVDVAVQDFPQDVVDERTLPAAAHAGDAQKRAQRQRRRDVLQVVMPGVVDLQQFLARRTTLRGDRDLLATREIRAGQAVLGRLEIGDGPFGDDLSAADAGAGAEVHDVIGGVHGFVIVLDDDDGVALIAQVLQRAEQHLVVARMQADRRLVQDVDHADEAATDLPGEPDALRLPAGQRRCGAVQRQIVETAAQQKAEPAADFFQDFVGDEAFGVVELEFGEELRGVGDAQCADFGERER